MRRVASISHPKTTTHDDACDAFNDKVVARRAVDARDDRRRRPVVDGALPPRDATDAADAIDVSRGRQSRNDDAHVTILILNLHAIESSVDDANDGHMSAPRRATPASGRKIQRTLAEAFSPIVLEYDDDERVMNGTDATQRQVNASKQRLERAVRVLTLDDFTMHYVNTESESLADACVLPSASSRSSARRRLTSNQRGRDAAAAERRADARYIEALTTAMRVECTKVPQPSAYSRLVDVCMRDRRHGLATVKDGLNARAAIRALARCDARARAISFDDEYDDDGGADGANPKRRRRDVIDDDADAPRDALKPRTLRIHPDAWTPLDNAERSARGETTKRSMTSTSSTTLIPAHASGGERDWVIFNTALVYAAAGSRGVEALGDGDAVARRRRPTSTPDASAKKRNQRVSDDDEDEDEDDEDEGNDSDDAYGIDDENQNDDNEKNNESDDDPVDDDAEFVGAKLLFLHCCAAFIRDARTRLEAFATWTTHPSTTNADKRRAIGLIQNALLYRFVVDIAPSDGDRAALFSHLVDTACLASERIAAQTRDGACVSSATYHSSSSTSIACAPTTNGNEDCGVFEISAAARDACECVRALLDAAEDAEGASRRHAKIRVQLEDAYANQWKCLGQARLAEASAKRAFMRDIRHHSHKLTRARDLLARVVDRRHAPGILLGGLGDNSIVNGQGARDVFEYISSDVVRAIKSQQHSQGSGDFALASAALGALASAAALGAADAFDAASYVDALVACVDALEGEFARSHVCDSTNVLVSLNIAKALAESASATT